MSGPFFFHERYREVVVLNDGRRVRLRMVLPSDKTRLLEGFQRLSDESRKSRFLSPKKRLTPEDLTYLTEFDGINHFALGAVELREDGIEGAGVGVARFTRHVDDPTAAEAAIVVLDAWQGHGLGRLLLLRLMAAACERGVRSFYAEFLSENTPVQRLLKSVCPEMSVRPTERGILGARIPLQPDHPRLGLG